MKVQNSRLFSLRKSDEPMAADYIFNWRGTERRNETAGSYIDFFIFFKKKKGQNPISCQPTESRFLTGPGADDEVTCVPALITWSWFDQKTTFCFTFSMAN
jgi:hypothetical protein